MRCVEHVYSHENDSLRAFVAYPESPKAPLLPLVLIAHDWSGRNVFVCEKARYFAKNGYVAFALDMYGQARTGETTEEKSALIEPFMANRAFLLARIQRAFQEACAWPLVDKNKIAALGFCFGGLCVLDLARSGVAINAVVSCHGLLNPPLIEDNKTNTAPIRAHVLALHGYDDPMVSPEQVRAFCDEMTRKGADWQVHMYGHTKHAFTNPKAHDMTLGTVYNALADKRAMQAVDVFFNERLG